MPVKKIQLTLDEIQTWHSRISSAEEWLEENVLPAWKKTLEDYTSEREHEGLVYGGDDVPEFNFLLATANVIVPSIVSADPYVRFHPRRPGDEEGARMGEAAVNYVFREIGIKDKVQDIVLDALLYNLGFSKVGYDPSGAFLLEEDYDTGPEQFEEEEGQMTPDARRALMKAMAAEDVPFEEGPSDNPTVERVAPWNMLLPSGYDDIQKCPWIAERMTVRLDDLRMDERFKLPKNLDADSWMSTGVPENYAYKEDQIFGLNDGDAEYITVYEIRYWARTKAGLRRRVMWMVREQEGVDTGETVIRHINDPLSVRGYPYQMLRFNRVPGLLYATKVAEIASVREIAERLNEEWGILLRHHRISSRRKWVGLPGILEDGQLAGLLESDQDMEVAELPANVGDIRNALMLLPEAAPPSTTPMVLQGLQRLMYEISGVDVYQRGGVGRKGTTATEVAVAAQGSSNRATTRLGVVERFTEAIARQVLSIIRQYWDEPRYMRVTGATGENEFVSFSSSDISGMYDVLVEAGSTIGKDPGTEQQAFMGLLQTIQATVGSLVPLVQSGMASPDTIKNFVDKAFSIWQADKRMLMQPLAALQAAASPAAPSPAGGPSLESVEAGRGMGGQGESLAGPRTEASPGGQTSGTGGTADLATLMSRVRGT